MEKKAILSSTQIHLLESIEHQSRLYQAILDEVCELKKAVWSMSQGDRISYSLQDAASATGLSYDTIYSYFKTGKLPGTQVAGKGGAVLIMRSDLEKFLLSNTKKTDEVYTPKGEKRKQHTGKRNW